MECPLSQSDETGAGAVSKTVWPLSFAFRCQACKEADDKNATLAFSSQTHFWKAVSVSHCAFKGVFEHVSGMSSVDAAPRPHQQLGRLEGIGDQKRHPVSMMRVRIPTSRSLSSSLLVCSAQLTLPLFRRMRKDIGIPPSLLTGKLSTWSAPFHNQMRLAQEPSLRPCGPSRLPSAARNVNKPMPRLRSWHSGVRRISGRPSPIRIALSQSISSM